MNPSTGTTYDTGASSGPGFAGPAAGTTTRPGGSFDTDFGSDTTDLHGADVDAARARPAKKPLTWNSGADLGLLVLRVVLGGIFVAHGAQKTFGWFDGPGFDGFGRALEGAGYRYSAELAVVTGITELAAGVLIVAGLLTPLAAAGIVGVMINAIALKWSGGFFGAGQGAGYEFDLALAAMAIALTLGGPGRVALDKGRTWFRHPVAFGWICLIVGAGAGVASLVLLKG